MAADYEPSTFVKNSITGRPISTTDSSVTVQLGDEDIAFVLGKGGVTKNKLALVSGAKLEIDEHTNAMTISGSPEARRRAQEYIDMVLAQRQGKVQVDLSQPREDLTIVEVPLDCVGYVTGRGGVVLRSLEAEFRTLMFFLTGEGQRERENLVIFGSPRGRLGSTLKVMSAIEFKKHGYYVHDKQFKGDLSQLFTDDMGLDQRYLEDDDFRYALGAGGTTRKKLARSSHCILEYIGNVAVMVGTKLERERASTYLNWLLGQRSGDSQIDVSTRDDCTQIPLTEDATGFVMGTKGMNLRDIEERAEVFLFVNGFNARRESGPPPPGAKTLLIFSHSGEEREKAKIMVERLMSGKSVVEGGGASRPSQGHGGGRRRSRDDRGGRGGGRRRSPSPPRHRRRSGSPRRGRGRSPSPQRSYRRRSPSPKGRHGDDRGGGDRYEARGGGRAAPGGDRRRSQSPGRRRNRRSPSE